MEQISQPIKTREILSRAFDEARHVNLDWIQPPPSENEWSLAPDTLKFLVALVKTLKPRHILEFGSGLSTRVLAKTCDEIGLSCSITSVDHDPEFGFVSVRDLENRKDVSSSVRFQLAPIVVRDCGGKWLPTYLLDPKKFASEEPVDLVLIDGPPLILGGREGVLYQAMDFVRSGSLILLDDAARVEEQKILSNWRDNLGSAIEVHRYSQFKKGLGVVWINQPVHRKNLWDHRLHLIRNDIAEHVPAGKSFILVDENWWGKPLAPDRRAFAFLEKDGAYWGSPADDSTAIAELERLRLAGAECIVFAWPAFWWLDYYVGFHEYLRTSFPRIMNHDHLVMFDLRKRDENHPRKKNHLEDVE